MGIRVGIDIGGTFTDLAFVDEETAETGVLKVTSTPGDYAAGVIQALKALAADRDVSANNLSFLRSDQPSRRVEACHMGAESTAIGARCLGSNVDHLR